MSACAPTRHDRTPRRSRPRRASGVKSPHSPPPTGGRRLRIAGADVSASITVFLIAVPMSLGLALAVGAPLEAGLVAAAIGGIVAGLLGGTPLQVSGPSAGLTVVTAELIQVYGWRTTCAITVGAGLLQILLGTLRAARNALAVSPAIVHGTLAGIGVAIALAQLHIMLGGSPQSSVVANALALPEQLARISPAAPLIGALTITVLLLWPRLPGRVGRTVRRIPAALASVVIATSVAAVATPGLARVDLPSWRSHALPELPQGPVLALATAVFTVLLVASLESLLAAVAVDKLAADRAGEQAPLTSPAPPRRSDLDRELRGQGIANTLTGLLGGLPVAGGVVRGSANVRAGATGRASTVLHGVWVLLAAGLLITVFEWIPLAALAALVMVVGIQMVSFAHIRNVHRHREFPVYAATVAGVVAFGALAGVAVGVGVAVIVSLHRLGRTKITSTEQDGRHVVTVHGQLTFLAVPRLTRALGQLPPGVDATVELDGFFMDHAAYEAIQAWRGAQLAQGGRVDFTGRSGSRIAEPAAAAHSCCRPWTPWRNHHCHDRPTLPADNSGATDSRPDSGSGSGTSPTAGAGRKGGAHRLLSGLSSFQRNTAPLVRDELARLASEGQCPSQLFITCADSRLVTSMITSSGPGDLFTVRNVGNLVPPPGTAPAGGGDDSVAAAIEYAVEVLRVESITVCGHSGCGAMQALLKGEPDSGPEKPRTPLWRWLRHGLPSLERMASRRHSWARISGRLPADEVEQLCLTNVVQQLEHLRAHESVARRLAEGTLQLHGMYFHVGEAQAYLLTEGSSSGTEPDEVFDRVGTGELERTGV
ncbi:MULTISPECIES: bifunctional SulP family inorganic anion transporter/carbonic anhydrase [Streptomyces]|uniref:bifunctional SulP family inorganic anion transporter/carbonic anhydrase n=1 Tax=Streptomyces TaxID=1883 RepID=UPI001C58AA1B|nr:MULTISPECIES: SulP family inorganic anion transporter [Streptomyces]MBW3359293.1 transporter [Streptomyces sp. 09ZI22]MEE1729000.1 SulP family inorganic anion transporter [Streptomyces sp. BE282]WSR92172.1 SulP family inorganic anion transporter [Streptomyces microflavus]